MKVFAIGATGFIGSQVVLRLVRQGHEVAVLHRGRAPAQLPEGVLRIHGNRDQPDDWRGHLASFAPDVVLDTIAYTQRQAQDLVAVCRGNAARLVVLSSADVYRNYDGFRGASTAPADPVPLTEQAPLRITRHPYRGADVAFEHAHDYDKILVEQALTDAPDLPATVLRLPAVYGPGDRQHRLRPYVQRMADGRPGIVLSPDQAAWTWTRGFVGNVAAAIALAVADARGAGRTYNVGEPALAEREWVERIGVAAGWQGAVVVMPRGAMPDSLALPYDWRYALWTDSARLREELGYVEPVALDEAVQRTVAWELSTLGDAPALDYRAEDALLSPAPKACG